VLFRSTGATDSRVQIGNGGDAGFNPGDTSVTIGLTPGEDVTCTFINTSGGTLTIKKVANPADGTNFAFTATGVPNADQAFTLDDINPQDADLFGNTKVIVLAGNNLGAKTITEALPAGWTLTTANCATHDSSRNGNTLSVTIAAGENIVCTFTNTKNPPPTYGGHDPGDTNPGDPYGQDPVDTKVVDPYTPPSTAPSTTTTTVDPQAGVAGDTHAAQPAPEQVLGGSEGTPGGLLPRTGAGILGEAILALLLVGSGLVLMRITRRRRTQPEA